MSETAREIPRSIKTERELSTEQEAANQFSGMVGTGARAASVLERKHHFGRFAFDFDSSGRLWVLTSRGDVESSVFDIFDSSFRYVGEVSVPIAISERVWQAGNLFDVQGKYLAAAIVDNLDNESVVVFELAR